MRQFIAEGLVDHANTLIIKNIPALKRIISPDNELVF
jgi:hypothetical protein